MFKTPKKIGVLTAISWCLNFDGEDSKTDVLNTKFGVGNTKFVHKIENCVLVFAAPF